MAEPSAAATKTNKPSVVSVAAIPDGQSVTVTYTINRTDKQIASQTCSLNGTTTPCDIHVDSQTAKPSTSTYSVTIEPLDDGDYTFTVTFTLTDGGSGSGADEFVIAPVCWPGLFDNAPDWDVKLIGPINTLDNGNWYDSADGTCSGNSYPVTLVQADTPDDAIAICSGLIPEPWDRMEAINLQNNAPTAPEDYWWCRESFIP